MANISSDGRNSSDSHIKHMFMGILTKAREIEATFDNTSEQIEEIEILAHKCNQIDKEVGKLLLNVGKKHGGENTTISKKDIRVFIAEIEAAVAKAKQGLYTNNGGGVQFNNQISNSSKSTASVIVNFDMVVNELIDYVNSNESLGDAEEQELIEKITEMKAINEIGTRKDKWKASREVLAWISTKGVDIASRVIPVILALIKQ